MKNEKKVFIVDVSNLLFRMHYVHKYLTDDEGHNTGAIFGVLNMLIFYANKTNIKDMILVWDSPSETSWRLEVYPEYKANRRSGFKDEEAEKTFNDIVFSKEMIWQITQYTGFINVYKARYEADDLIGMLIRLLKRDIKILTMDKDLLQFVDDNKKIRVFRPLTNQKKKEAENKSYEIYNEKTVKEEFGIEPKRFHELLALAGDSCDGVPGVRGYAYKKASQLLNSGIDLKEKLSKEDYAIYERNLMLVNLHFVPGSLERQDFEFGANIKPDLVQSLLDRLKIKKFTAEDLIALNNKEFKVRLLRNFIG